MKNEPQEDLQTVDKVIPLLEVESVWETTSFTLRFKVSCMYCKKEFYSPSMVWQFCSEACSEDHSTEFVFNLRNDLTKLKNLENET